MIPIDVSQYFVPIIGFLLAYMLKGIKDEIKEVRSTVQDLEKNLRDGISDIDRRVVKIETGCGVCNERRTS